jgi:HAD superfamily hydrolase (TIGR01509 family)
MVTTLVFDCDGVLADTERHGHLPAFNQTFAEFGLPVRWSEDEYGKKLEIGGGKERIASLLTDELVRGAGIPRGEEEQKAAVSKWHERKTQIYVEMVMAGKLPARPGIRRVINDAIAAGWQVAVASTSAEPAVRAIVQYVAGEELAARIPVFAGDVVAKKKPASDIYQLALEQLGAHQETTLVIEDSRNGLLAATGAGLRCLITVNGYTENEDFTEAVMVVSSLGDPGGAVAAVLANRGAAHPGPFIVLDDLQACLD